MAEKNKQAEPGFSRTVCLFLSVPVFVFFICSCSFSEGVVPSDRTHRNYSISVKSSPQRVRYGLSESKDGHVYLRKNEDEKIYLVISSGFLRREEAFRLEEDLRKRGIQSETIRASDWFPLEPGYYHVVFGDFENEDNARIFRADLARYGIQAEVRAVYPSWRCGRKSNLSPVARYYLISGSFSDIQEAKKERKYFLELGMLPVVVMCAPSKGLLPEEFTLLFAVFDDSMEATRAKEVFEKRTGKKFHLVGKWRLLEPPKDDAEFKRLLVPED